jgi:hypothetical protein
MAAFYGLLFFFLVLPALRGQQASDDARNLARNPVGDAIKLPLTESISFDAGPYGRTSHSLQFSPLIPLQLNERWLLIPRIVASPFNYVADPARPSGGTTGMGDTVATLFLTRASTRRVIWGAGLSIAVPTATDANIGAGKWDIGPSVAVIVQPDWGSAGVVVANIKSLPGNATRTPVHVLQIETSLSYNLPQSWYVFTSPTIAADWTQTGRDRWLAPFGGGIGRTVTIAHRALDVNIALYSNAIRPYRLLSPKWQIGLQCTLFYPRKRR